MTYGSGVQITCYTSFLINDCNSEDKQKYNIWRKLLITIA